LNTKRKILFTFEQLQLQFYPSKQSMNKVFYSTCDRAKEEILFDISVHIVITLGHQWGTSGQDHP